MENIETVETTSETTTETTLSDDGRTHTETVTTTAEVPVVRHCDCAECQAWEEDVADHIAYLSERLDRLEEPAEGLAGMPENGATETVVESPPPGDADKGKAKETPSETPAEGQSKPAKKARRKAGFFF